LIGSCCTGEDFGWPSALTAPCRSPQPGSGPGPSTANALLVEDSGLRHAEVAWIATSREVSPSPYSEITRRTCRRPVPIASCRYPQVPKGPYGSANQAAPAAYRRRDPDQQVVGSSAARGALDRVSLMVLAKEPDESGGSVLLRVAHSAAGSQGFAPPIHRSLVGGMALDRLPIHLNPSQSAQIDGPMAVSKDPVLSLNHLGGFPDRIVQDHPSAGDFGAGCSQPASPRARGGRAGGAWDLVASLGEDRLPPRWRGATCLRMHPAPPRVLTCGRRMLQ
jgi:hypothetical protein